MTDEEAASVADKRRFLRELASGTAMVGFILWLTFFGTAGLVEVATLVVAVAVLIWFATVDPVRLMDSPDRPSLMLFFLGLVGCGLVLTAALILETGTLLLIAGLTLIALGIGLSRALAFRYRQPPEVEDGIP